MEYEKCYVFQPNAERPTKRRRTEQSGLQTSWPLRRRLYEREWRRQQACIEKRLSGIHAASVAQVAGFLADAQGKANDEKIQSAFILAGLNATSHGSILDHLAKTLANDKRKSVVRLSSSDGSNLKALLKALISKATSTSIIDDDDDEVDNSQTRGKHQGPKLLSYDLQRLRNYVHDKGLSQVIIAFEDTEAFESMLLSDTIEHLSCWLSSIPFACVFRVATSVDFLQQRLTNAAVSRIDGALFDVAPVNDEVEEILDAITAHNDEGGDPRLWVGPNLMSSMLERQTDYVTDIGSFVQSFQFASMACFYANALSVFWDARLTISDCTSDHFEALRHLPSFQQRIQDVLEAGDTAQARELLDNNNALLEMVRRGIADGIEKLFALMDAVSIIRCLQTLLPDTPVLRKSRLYVLAMSGKLRGSAMLRGMLLAIRRSDSSLAMSIFKSLERQAPETYLRDEVKALSEELASFGVSAEVSQETALPLRSEDSIANSTLRTTVVAQKVALHKNRTALSKKDVEYTALIRRFSNVLERYFDSSLINPKSDLPFHEIFIYDLKSPHRELFAPRPRHALERALATPHDYLACECCTPGKTNPNETEDEEITLSASQPATAVLYQLYLESGSLINASDLWQAFHAVLGGEDVVPEQSAMAQFQRALAEMKYFGMVKSTRKKVDHIAKVSWRGL